MTDVGSFALVLHTHLPWVAHNGTWPVGEEWLHQAFTGSWQRVIGVIERLAADGLTEVLTLGITPIVAAMLDDPYCLKEIHSWAGRWQLRAEEFGARSALGGWERAAATASLADLEARWLTGGLSSVLRPLVDTGVVEMLSGPATHPFQPLLTERFASAQLRTGLTDAQLRLGVRPSGIWAPECGYAPGMADFYAAHDIERFVVDGPAVAGATAFGHPVDGTDVIAFARDEELSNRVWSARTGYPGGPDYRDFHTFDHASGFRPARVTGPRDDKQPWVPDCGFASAVADAEHFAAAVIERLASQQTRYGRESLVVAAFDTELFGHWWYEGPVFLENVLRTLAKAGVRLTTLAGAQARGLVGEPVELPASSWGAGKDWRVWENAQVAEINDELAHLQKRLFGLLDERASGGRDAALDQLVREAFLAGASDWAFMITRDSAADYAWQRVRGHVRRFHDLADAITEPARAASLAAELRAIDGPFGHLDARTL